MWAVHRCIGPTSTFAETRSVYFCALFSDESRRELITQFSTVFDSHDRRWAASFGSRGSSTVGSRSKIDCSENENSNITAESDRFLGLQSWRCRKVVCWCWVCWWCQAVVEMWVRTAARAPGRRPSLIEPTGISTPAHGRRQLPGECSHHTRDTNRESCWNIFVLSGRTHTWVSPRHSIVPGYHIVVDLFEKGTNPAGTEACSGKPCWLVRETITHAMFCTHTHTHAQAITSIRSSHTHL